MHSEGKEEIAWVVDDIGGRQVFEDAHFLRFTFLGDPGKILFGILDGHGGKGVAEFAARRFPEVFSRLLESGIPAPEALRRTFIDLDVETRGLDSGAVAVVAFISGSELVTANAGDAELILVSKKSWRILSELHRLNNEKERLRVVAKGARIRGDYVSLESGDDLQCTRSLGDHAFKAIGVIPDPFVSERSLGPDDIWLIAGCDGLWDFMLPDEVAKIARGKGTAKEVAEALHHEAVSVRRTTDNLTVMAVKVRN